MQDQPAGATNQRILLQMREGPGSGRIARERLDVVLMALALEQTVSVAFIDDGVFQLLPLMDDGEGRSLLKMIRSLQLYDVTAIYVERESLLEHRIGEVDPVATVLSRDELRQVIEQQDLLL